MKRKVLAGVAVFLMLLSYSVSVFAGAKWESLSDGEKQVARNLYAYLRLAGYSDSAASGICGNADQESQFNTTISSGSHHGAFQMSDDQWANMKQWASSKGLDYTDIVVQFKFIEATKLDSDFKTTTTMTLAEYKQTNDIVVGTEGFMVAYERCVGGSYTLQKVQLNPNYGNYKYQHGELRVEYASNLYTALVGTPPADSGGGETGGGTSGETTEGGATEGETTETVAEQLAARGYYTEDQLSSYMRLQEINIDEKYIEAAKRESLAQSELEGLVNWERNVSFSKEEDGFMHTLRVLTMLIGIFFIVWSILMYVAYWFDKLNTILPFELLSILTLGNLQISGDESNHCFHIGSKGKKAVNHKNIVFICVVSIAFGTLLITGVFYIVVASFVNFVLRILN